jgi:hypothetical protein
MLTALVLICSIAVTPNLADCSRKNAIAVIRVPGEFVHPVSCFMQGQAFLAAMSIGQEFGSDDRAKIVCRPIETVDADLDGSAGSRVLLCV